MGAAVIVIAEKMETRAVGEPVRPLAIGMAGVDHNKARVAVRERFSLTQKDADAAMKRIVECPGVLGCVLICTCNRTELWISGAPERTPWELLCQAVGADPLKYQDCFFAGSGHEAVEHLFYLACGLLSQVFGEEQIITQVGNALQGARQAGTADPALEQLFRAAVTTAKKVHTDVKLTSSDRSVAVSLVEFLRGKLGELRGLNCMVIGSGEMGRLAAAALERAGCRVMMTVRTYRHGETTLPAGVYAVPYEQRYTWLPTMRVAVSATASPHYTLTAEEMPEFETPLLLCDLAVPRDIDPRLSGRHSLYDTDDICGRAFKAPSSEGLRQANEQIRQDALEFENWYQFRSLVPLVKEISRYAAGDFMNRVNGYVDQAGADGQLGEQLRAAADKTISKLLFGIKENLEPQMWESCLRALEESIRPAR